MGNVRSGCSGTFQLGPGILEMTQLEMTQLEMTQLDDDPPSAHGGDEAEPPNRILDEKERPEPQEATPSPLLNRRGPLQC